MAKLPYEWSAEDIAINEAMGNTAADLRFIANLAKLEAEEHARFASGLNNNLVDGILSCAEEDAEVGRIWGIDASRTEGGE